MNRSDVISVLERADVEVQQDVTWTQLRPLYDDLVKKLCANLRKPTEEKVVSESDDENQQTVTTTTIAKEEESSVHEATEAQTNETAASSNGKGIGKNATVAQMNETAVTVEEITSDADGKSKHKPVQPVQGQQQNEQNQSKSETHSDGVEHSQQKQKHGNDVPQLKFGTFGDMVNEQEVYSALPMQATLLTQESTAETAATKRSRGGETTNSAHHGAATQT